MVPTAAKRLMRLSFFEFQAPLDISAATVRDVQEFWSLRTRSRNELIEAGIDLAHLNAKYETSIQRNAALEGEVARLQELLKLPSYTEYRAEPARVARRDFNVWWQRMVIRKGRNYGITEGAPVIFVGGVVGRVRVVHAYTSEVELISNPGLRMAATIEGDTRPLSYQGGNNPTFGPAKGTVEFVPLDVTATPSASRRLVTSGVGGVFPAGLTIGQIFRVDPSTDGLFKTGEVRLDPRLDSVSEVTVLIPLQTD
ncbi:MAG: rod shape-determining protein MreC [Verrucomicrobia bacterium]|nr:rod shape-determining protein MreC [Verrucomicrobiota bacterium]